jgi:translation elongation factor EF-G
LITSVKNGFWLACSSGPLANEQMMGVIFIIEKIQAISKPKEEKSETENKLADKKEVSNEAEDNKEKKEEQQVAEVNDKK